MPHVRPLHPASQSGVIRKISLSLAAGGLMLALVAGVAWLSFDRIVVLQRQIIEETVPAMDAVGTVSQLTPSTIALFQELKLSRTPNEVDRLERQGMDQLARLEASLSRLARQSFEPDHVLKAQATVADIRANLQEQVAKVRESLELQERIGAGLSSGRKSVRALMLLAEALTANASTYTSATVSSLYPMVDRDATRAELLNALDWLADVDIDRMERMSELQLVCFRLGSLLDRLEGAESAQVAKELENLFAADLAILSRRIQDFRDPTRKALGDRHRRVLSTALGRDGLFALQGQRTKLERDQDALQLRGAALAIRLTHEGAALLDASQLRVEQMGAGSRQAIGRGALGFLAAGAILMLSLAAASWLFFRYELLGRLKSLEGTMRDLMAGRYEVTIARSRRRRDPLEPLVNALELFRSHAIERTRLERSLREHQLQLETQVAERTAKLRHSNTLLEREVELHAKARQQAEEAHRAKNEFLGSLSHELRTPLSGVRGSVQLLRDTALDGRQREYVRMIDHANSTLLETLEDMLGFSRLEAGKLEVVQESFLPVGRGR